MKPFRRAIGKASQKYNGDFSRLLDLSRGSIVLPSVEAVCKCLEAAYQDDNVQVRSFCSNKFLTPQLLYASFMHLQLSFRS